MEVGATIVPHIASTLWAALPDAYTVEVSSGYMSDDTITVTRDDLPDARVVIEANPDGYAALHAEARMRDGEGEPWNALPLEGYSEWFDLTGLDETECDALVGTEVAHWVEAAMSRA